MFFIDIAKEEELVEAVAAIEPNKINTFEHKKELELPLLRLTKQTQLFERGACLEDFCVHFS